MLRRGVNIRRLPGMGGDKNDIFFPVYNIFARREIKTELLHGRPVIKWYNNMVAVFRANEKRTKKKRRPARVLR